MHRSLLDAWNAVSLRTKITGVTVLVLAFGLLLSGIGTMLLFRPVLLQQLDQQLTAASDSANINAMLPSTPSTQAVQGDSDQGNYFVALYDQDGRLLRYNWREDPSSERPAVGASLSSGSVSSCKTGSIFALASNDGTGQFRARCVPVRIQQSDGSIITGTAIVAASTGQIDAVMASYLTIFLGFGVIVVVVGAILTRMLVSSTFAPLRQVEHTAAAIAEGDYSQRLTGGEPNTEVGRLNRSLNIMISRFDRAYKDRARTIDQMRRFVGDASHELRTPLVSVRGYAELYRMGALPDEDAVAGAMERIEKEAVRMSGLVEDLLELARLDETRPLQLTLVDLLPLAYDAAMDAGAAHPSRHFSVTAELPAAPPPLPGPSSTGIPLDHTQAIRVVTDAEAKAAKAATPARGIRAAGRTPGRGTPARGTAKTAPTASASNAAPEQTMTGPIAFTASALARLRRRNPRRPEPFALAETVPLELDDIPEPHRIPAVVLAEENKLRQVLGNLIGNAVRYTPVGSPIDIAVSVDAAQRLASVAVVDHGEGIPPEIREKIFQRFWRADTSRARETGGNGLGLAIVTSIVHAHHGSVEVVDTPGGGATFRVLLPLAEQ